MKDLRIYLTTILLGAAITLIAIGIHTYNFIDIGIGGALAGVYNGIINKRD
jgi:hypothetical protein